MVRKGFALLLALVGAVATIPLVVRVFAGCCAEGLDLSLQPVLRGV